jgi:hypothetical protein
MPLIQNIPRKEGRITPRSTSASWKRGMQIFPQRTIRPANVGDVANPGNPGYLSAVGLDYNNQTSKTGGATNPLGTQHNIGTQGYVKPLYTVGSVGVTSQMKNVTEVQPHEKGTFFASQKPLNTTKVRQSGGVSKTSDSAFHPKLPPVNRPRRYPTPAGERTQAESFGSTHTLSAKPEMDIGGSRWSRIKKSASDAPTPYTTVPQTARQAVGGGGYIQSTSRAPVQNQSHIGGGGFGSKYAPLSRPVPWRVQQTNLYSGGGPLATQAPFPQKLGCKKGCK